MTADFLVEIFLSEACDSGEKRPAGNDAANLRCASISLLAAGKTAFTFCM